jgi:hypothetical protein
MACSGLDAQQRLAYLHSARHARMRGPLVEAVTRRGAVRMREQQAQAADFLLTLRSEH